MQGADREPGRSQSPVENRRDCSTTVHLHDNRASRYNHGMRRIQRLFALQQIDLSLDTSRKRVREIDARLTESDALRAARQTDQNVRQHLGQLRVRAKDLELESSALDTQIKTVEDRMYSGAVKNPKELGDLQKDATSLRKRKSELDETQLELMLELEQVGQQAADARAGLMQIEAEWQRDQAALRAERARLVEDIAALDEQRKTQRADVPPPDLTAYDQLRSRRHGQAVTPVEDGTCSTCGVELSEHKIARLQREDGLIACGNCERLLIVA